MPETPSQFNPKLLAFARRRRGLSKVQLAERLGIAYRTLVGYELGEFPPSIEIMNSMGTILGFPAIFFYGSDLEELSVRDVSFRALTKMSAKQRDMARAQAELAVRFSKWLEARFELPELSLPDFRHEADAETAAEALREYWQLGQLPIRNLLHLLESKGIRVFSIDVEGAEVDAISTWKAGVPFAFLNRRKTAERSRFDAAHELGHLVLHRHGSPLGRVAEDEAQRFASAFLMPRATVLAHAPRFPSLTELFRLKKLFGVSVAAISYRLHTLELLTDWQYRSLAIEISKRGYRVSEPYEGPRETSLILPLLLSQLYEEGITRNGIAQELGWPVQELENLLFSLVLTGLSGGKASKTVDLKKTQAQTRLSRIK